MSTRKLVFLEGSSNRFWNIRLEKDSHTVNYGRVGNAGQSKTKEFEDADAAQKSFDVLVAQKLKKGYVDSDAADDTQDEEPAEKNSDAKKSDAGKATTKPTPSEPDVDLSVTHEIDLDERGWFVATFRKSEKLDPGVPRAADIDAAAEKMSWVRTTCYGRRLQFETMKFDWIMAREEAHFWLYAMTYPGLGPESEKEMEAIIRSVRETNFDGKITLKNAIKRLRGVKKYMPEQVMIPLFSLFSVEDCLEVIFLLGHKERHYSKITKYLTRGFQQYVFPHLTQKEIGALKKRVRPTLDPTVIADCFTRFPVEHYLAAVFGMHKELLQVTSSWDDDQFADDEGRRNHYVKWEGVDDNTDYHQNPQQLVLGLETAEIVESEWRRLQLKINDADEARGFLACTEFSALDYLAECICRQVIKDNCVELLEVLALVRAPEAAEPMLRCRISSIAPGAVARDWMSRNVGNCVAGLIETAGKDGKLSDAAIDYLREVKRNGHEDLIVKYVKKAEKKSAGAARIQLEVLDRKEKIHQPMDAKTTPKWLQQAIAAVTPPKKPAKLPAWVNPSRVLPLVVGETRLNDEQVVTVLQVLATTAISERHPLLVSIKEHIDKPSRDDFAWGMFQLWQEDGSDTKQKWVMGAIGHLGDDDCVLKLTPLVRAWPGESQHARAVFGLECLRGVGSNAALMQLSSISQKLKYKGLKAKAAVFVGEIAKEKGMTCAELEDRVIPDCGLDEQGRREFSFGARSFSFVLGSDLKPMVRGEDGKVRPNMPKPGTKDDEAIATASLAEWKLMKKQIKDVAVLQSGRLEVAMVAGRRWSVDDYGSFLVRHPLMTHLVQKLIWGAFDKKGKRLSLFRIAEERNFTDENDNAIPLTKADTIGLLHPLEMTDAERATWGEILSDYEIISPFPQLGRAVYTLEKGEKQAVELERFHGLKLEAPAMIYTLEKLGWIRGEVLDGGGFSEYFKQFPLADVTAVIYYDGNVAMGYIEPDEILTTVSICFFSGMIKPSKYGVQLEKIMMGDVFQTVTSEVVADLQFLKSKVK